MKWFFERDGKKNGPISPEELAAEVRAGNVHDTTLVWRPGLNGWVRFATVAHELPGSETPPPMPTPPPTPVVTFSPAPETSADRLREPQAVEAVAPIPAGFGARAAARLIDMVTVWIGSQILISMVGALYFRDTIELLQTMTPGSQPPPEQVVPILKFAALALFLMGLTGLLYEIVFVAWRAGTPGKLIFRLRVADERGENLGVGAVVGRALAFMLNAFTFGLAFFMPLIDEQRRGLHDFICGSRVVRRSKREES